MPPNDPLTRRTERLVHDLAAQAGLVLRNVRLIEELRAVPARIVAAQDEERRKLERNIHDGAQQQLVALAVQLRLADTMVDGTRRKRARSSTSSQGDTQTRSRTCATSRAASTHRCSRIRGSAAALEAQARKSPVPVESRPTASAGYPQDVEAAVYFSCLEALQNVAKYAEASRATISLERCEGHSCSPSPTTDAGSIRRPPTGPGLRDGRPDRRDRRHARDRQRPGRGTTVTGRVPANIQKHSDRPVPKERPMCQKLSGVTWAVWAT